MTPRDLAIDFHDTYERLSAGPEFHRIPFDDMSDQARAIALAVAIEIYTRHIATIRQKEYMDTTWGHGVDDQLNWLADKLPGCHDAGRVRRRRRAPLRFW